MATVHWPRDEVRRCRHFAHLQNVPFLLDGEESYPEGVNAFIAERVRGSLPGTVNGKPRFRLEPLGKHAAKKLAYNLCDILTWMETTAAHPTLGKIEWRDIQPWHITELYMDAMLLGFWSENYWAKRVPAPLEPATAKERAGEALRCFSWTAAQGYSGQFDYEPSIKVIQRSKDDALLAYRSEMISVSVQTISARVRPVRRQPGNTPLPTLEHLHEFFSEAPKGAKRLALRHIFETGMRAEEVVENSLIPGRLHTRTLRDDTNSPYALWPTVPYVLDYNLTDDRMLGVIPTEDHAWSPSARRGYQCEYRILGKGPKIRKVSFPPQFVQALWAHIRSSRRGQSAYVYLNRSGHKLSYRAIWETCGRINRKLRAPIDITPHVLRHAHACYFLEITVLQQARNHGYSAENIPHSFLREFGETVLLLIKLQLGHSEFSTTQKYLEQLISGRLGLTYYRMWNSFLDNTRVM